MRYVIYGAGAIGSAIGAELFSAGFPVVLIARGKHLEAISAGGLVYSRQDEDRHLKIPVVATLAEANVGEDDAVFLCMKSQDTYGALQELARSVSPNVHVICAQNGVDNERMALRLFRNVYGLVVRIPAVFTEPGRVTNRARPSAGILDIGRYPRGTDAAAERIAQELTAAGFDSAVQANVMRWKYGKLLENLATPVDALFADSAARDEIIQLVKAEARNSLNRAGIDVASDNEKQERRRHALDYDPRKDPDRPGGSVWQSLARNTGSVEVDFMNGEIVLLGRLTGTATPVNEAVQRITNRVVRDGGLAEKLDARSFLDHIEEPHTT